MSSVGFMNRDFVVPGATSVIIGSNVHSVKRIASPDFTNPAPEMTGVVEVGVGEPCNIDSTATVTDK